MVKSITSCITDHPIAKYDDDMLGNNAYVDGLLDFILNAETPVTIGVQGGWGSGKTSLINMLQEKLLEDEEHGTLCIFVNAWEHSLFQVNDNKAEVAISLLGGLLEGMEEAIENNQFIPDDTKKTALGNDVLGKAKKAIMGAAVFSFRAAVKMSSGVDVLAQKSEKAPESPSAANAVRDMRKNLEKLISSVTDIQKAGCPKRFVFFIDDLDRVPPEIAVEILDTTKNIFNLSQCIFVLAIDYDVVVKGLEGKFGKKTDENEREFRQYFDKIIQIPFTMPVGAYERQMNALLQKCFISLGYIFGNEETDKAILANIREATLAATDGVPRSVKRIVNTLSLLQRISRGKKSGEDNEARRLNDLEISFIVISLHINFPEICRRIMEYPAFTGWTQDKLQKRWSLPEADFNALVEYGETFDEPWEKVVYCLCQKNPWLKMKAQAVSTLMNKLRDALKRNSSFSEKTTLTEDETDKLNGILSSIRVVSIESTPLPAVDNSRVRTDQVSNFFRKLHNCLYDKIKGMPPCIESNYWAKRQDGYRVYAIDLDDIYIQKLSFQWYKDENIFYICIIVVEPDRNIRKFRKDIEELCEKKNIEYQKREIFIGIENFTYDDFLRKKPEIYTIQCINFFENVRTIAVSLID
jgi:hypothetical protein